MASRRSWTAAFVLSVSLAASALVVSGLTAAQAADPGFCKPYTQAALSQVRSGLVDPACAVGMQGARWSSEFAVHYEWCLGASPDAAGAERDARASYLRRCAGR